VDIESEEITLDAGFLLNTACNVLMLSVVTEVEVSTAMVEVDSVFHQCAELVESCEMTEVITETGCEEVAVVVGSMIPEDFLISTDEVRFEAYVDVRFDCNRF
jgi:hypothetical protein